MTEAQPPAQEQFYALDQIKAWPGQGIPEGSPVSVKGRVKNSFPIETRPGAHGDFSYQNFFLEGEDGTEMKVHWTSPSFDLGDFVGQVVILGQWNKGGKQTGRCKTTYYQDQAQLQVGGSCLQLEDSSLAPAQAPVPTQPSFAPPPANPASYPALPPSPSPSSPPSASGIPATQAPARGGAPKPTVEEVWSLQSMLYRRWKELGCGDEQAIAAFTNTMVIGVTQGRILDTPAPGPVEAPSPPAGHLPGPGPDPEAHPDDSKIPF